MSEVRLSLIFLVGMSVLYIAVYWAMHQEVPW